MQVTFSSRGLELRSATAAAWGADPPVTNKTAGFAGAGGMWGRLV